MKPTLFIIVFFFSLNIFGQELTERVGEIEVQLISHRFKHNSKGEITSKKTNKKNRPFLKMYFESTGILLKSVSFGKHHNKDLRLIDKINLFEYVNGRLLESVDYESDYKSNVYPSYKSKYIYNKKEELIEESTYHYETDSLFFRTTYEYDLSSNKVKSIFNPTYYYHREFDSLNRITALKQVYDGKLRWDWNYEYSNNERVGIFQTYYNDGKDYSKKEIQRYSIQGLLIETEEIHVSKNGLDEKSKLYYDDNGLIKRVEHYQSCCNHEGYEMVSYYEVMITSKIKVDPEIVKSINERLILNKTTAVQLLWQ